VATVSGAKKKSKQIFTYFTIYGNVMPMKEKGKPIYVGKDLHARVKSMAASVRLSMRDYIEPYLELALSKSNPKRAK
jgi:hypothetical protein